MPQSQEGPELALDEARDGALAFLRAGEERLELLLDRAVEDALLGAAARVAPLLAAAASRGVRMRAKRSALVHDRPVAANAVPVTRRLQHRRQGPARRSGTPVHIRIAADRSLNEPANALAPPHAHGTRRAPRAQSACSMPADQSSRQRHKRGHRPHSDHAHAGGGILRPALGTPSDPLEDAVTFANSSAPYLAVYDVLCRVTAIRGSSAVEAPSSRRPRAQVTGGCEERMGEPRNAEDLRGRPDKA